MSTTMLVNALTNGGGEWVLWVLVALSVLSVAILVDRIVYFVSNREPVAVLLQGMIQGASAEGPGRTGTEKGPLGRLIAIAAENWALGDKRLAAALNAQRLQERAAAERGLVWLGTLGNNAPFIGLFGTVLGIIRAFKDLVLTSAQGPGAVMNGISEALVATAVGILVAIPAVFAYNLCQRQIRVVDYRLEEAAETLCALASGARAQ